jgi:hypothetical protein
MSTVSSNGLRVPEIEMVWITTLGFTTNPSTIGVVLNLFAAAFAGALEWHEQSVQRRRDTQS